MYFRSKKIQSSNFYFLFYFLVLLGMLNRKDQYFLKLKYYCLYYSYLLSFKFYQIILCVYYRAKGRMQYLILVIALYL